MLHYKSFLKPFLNFIPSLANFAKQVRPRVAVSQIMLNKENKILFGQRKDFGTWATPMGHLEMFEKFEDCCSRELREETDVIIDPQNFKHFCTIQNYNRKLEYHYVNFLYVCQFDEEQAIKNVEPEKCYGWNWKTCNEMYELPRIHKFDVTNTLLDMFTSQDNMISTLRGIIGSNKTLRQSDTTKPIMLKPNLSLTYSKYTTNPFCKKNQRVSVHYTGRFEDGTIFDSSVPRKKPIEFELGAGQVIPAWEIAIENLRIGEKAEIIAGYEWAYGKEGIPGAIPPMATLIFEVEVVSAK